METADRKHRSSVTFVVFTYNEEQRIQWVIKNFAGWGKVLVVDNYSKDRTVEIATLQGCEVLLNKNPGWVEDSETTRKVKAAVTTEWIYWAYADEMLDEPTLNAIMHAVESGRYQIVNITRKNYYYGRFCHDAHAHRANRIFQKNAIDFSENTIHQFGRATVPEDQICYLNSKYFVHHFMSNNAKSWLQSMDRYTDIQALTYSGKLDQFAIAVRLAKTLVGNYFVRGAYKAGFAGLSVVIGMMYYECLLLMKAYEHREHLDEAAIEALNDKSRRSLLDSGQEAAQVPVPVKLRS